MRRRDFISLIGGAAVWPLAAWAQQGEQMRRLGVLSNIGESDIEAQSMAAALHRGLRELGWVNGRNLQVDHRWGAGNPERIAAFAKELVALKPEVIVAHTTPSVIALSRETNTVPLVFVQVSDPIGTGFITNMAHPGGNITGFTNFESSMVGKWVELLKDMAPGISRVAFLFNPETAPYVTRYYQRPLETSARALGIEPWAASVSSATDIESAIAKFGREPDGGFIMMPDSFNIVLFSGAAHVRINRTYDAARHRGGDFFVWEGRPGSVPPRYTISWQDGAETRTLARWQGIMQSTNHGTQHRAEAAHMLTELGHSPGDIDLIVYLNERRC